LKSGWRFSTDFDLLSVIVFQFDERIKQNLLDCLSTIRSSTKHRPITAQVPNKHCPIEVAESVEQCDRID
jgi:hypothetical protein